MLLTAGEEPAAEPAAAAADEEAKPADEAAPAEGGMHDSMAVYRIVLLLLIVFNQFA